MIDASQMIEGRGPRASFCSRLLSFFLPDAPAAKAARTLDWTCATDDELRQRRRRTQTVTLMTRSRSTCTDRPRFRPLHEGFSRPAAAASLWYSCAGALR